MINKDSISFRDIINQVISVFKYLFSKWLMILIAGILGGVLGIVYAVVKTPTYSATLNFVLSNNSSSNGSLMGLASQFGVNLGNDNNDVFSGDNIITLMTSRRMVQQALFAKPPNCNTSLLNSYIKNNELNDGWNEKDRPKNA